MTKLFKTIIKSMITTYSRVPNKRDGWNKRDGGTFPSKLINVMFLINVMVENFESFFIHFLARKMNISLQMFQCSSVYGVKMINFVQKTFFFPYFLRKKIGFCFL